MMKKKVAGVLLGILVLAGYAAITRQAQATPEENVSQASPIVSAEASGVRETASVIEAVPQQEPTVKAKPSDLAIAAPSTSEEVGAILPPVEAAAPSYDVTENGKYKLLTVDGGDLSGYREPLAVVDVGFGEREYWAYTNEYGQLVRVVAKQIVLQDSLHEPLTSKGRYYPDEAKVPGTEHPDLDEGHVIADSLGGVANAYNITPQDSMMNRYGDQAYMEKVIRDAGGCEDFEAIISYVDTQTQIPIHYHITYVLRGNKIVEDFENTNPESVTPPAETKKATPAPTENTAGGDVATVDKNGNGTVTIAEAKAAGFKMPIKRGHWLYPYMIDKDGDGMVGE